MTTLTPIPAEQRAAYYDALLAGRAEAARLGIPLLDDRIFIAFHRALYRPMLDAHGERIATAIEAKRVQEDGAYPTFDTGWDCGHNEALEQAAAIARAVHPVAASQDEEQQP
jgi:hypothetical protein